MPPLPALSRVGAAAVGVGVVAAVGAITAVGALAAAGLLACHDPATAPRTRAPAPAVRHHDAVDATIASADGVPIHYHTEGEGRTALVFVHGWSCDRGFWSEQVSRFSADHQVVSLDLAGHGESGKGRKSWTIDAFGEDVRAVVTALDLRRVVLIGHSLGGEVILEAARLMPERVIGLVQVDTVRNVEQRYDPAETEPLLASWEKDFSSNVKKFADLLLPKKADPVLQARIEKQFASAAPAIAVAVIRQFFAYDSAAAFERVKAPIRAINSFGPTDVEANRRHSPGYAAVDLSPLNLGHFPMLAAPALFDQKLADLLHELETAPGS